MLDQLFGEENFVNEVIWKRQSSHNDAKQGSKHLGRVHDTILLYAGGKDYFFEHQYRPYDEKYVEDFYRHVEPETATTLLQNCVDLKTVQKLLGHRNLESIMRYLAKAKSPKVRAKVNAVWAQNLLPIIKAEGLCQTNQRRHLSGEKSLRSS